MCHVPDTLAWAVEAFSLPWEDLDPCASPTSSHSGQSDGEVEGLPMQENHSDCSRVAQYALILGSNDHVKPDPSVPAQSADSAFRSDPSQESVTLKSACMAARVSAIKDEGFSEALAAQIRLLKEIQPDPSMRQSRPFLQSGATVIRWTSKRHHQIHS